MIGREAKKLVLRYCANLIESTDLSVDARDLSEEDLARVCDAKLAIVAELRERGHGLWRGNRRRRRTKP